LVFVRTRRPIILLASATAVVAAALLAATIWLIVHGSLEQASLLSVAAIFAVAFLLRSAFRLWRWPLATIAFFRDALVVRTGKAEVRAPWERVELVTLAEPSEWTAMRWPEVRLTDRLTVRMRGGHSFRLHPRSFGLDPIACRDLVLRLRDEPSARTDLPEFDSMLDLMSRREVGELMKPRL
jgi:hypothetical protein